MRLYLMTAIWSALAWSTDVAAQPANIGFPFGLDHLRWKMTDAEISTEFLHLVTQTKAPPNSPITDQPNNYFGPYKWHDCTFNIALGFSQNQLDGIVLDAIAPSPICQAAILQELNLRYGIGKEIDLPISKAKPKVGENVKWTSLDSSVVYNGIDNGVSSEVGLSELGNPPIIVADPVGETMRIKPPPSMGSQ